MFGTWPWVWYLHDRTWAPCPAAGSLCHQRCPHAAASPQDRQETRACRESWVCKKRRGALVTVAATWWDRMEKMEPGSS